MTGTVNELSKTDSEMNGGSAKEGVNLPVNYLQMAPDGQKIVKIHATGRPSYDEIFSVISEEISEVLSCLFVFEFEGPSEEQAQIIATCIANAVEKYLKKRIRVNDKITYKRS